MKTFEVHYSSHIDIEAENLEEARKKFVDQFHLHAGREVQRWIPVEERLPEVGKEVTGYHDKWVDEDFNPNGTRVCFVDDIGDWTSAKWNNEQDCYDTCSVAFEEDSIYITPPFAPTHWMPLPNKPELT